MGVLDYSIWIAAAPEHVWRIYVEPTRIPEWQTGKPAIRDIQGVSGAPGSAYVSKRGPLTARTTVLAADAARRLVTSTDAYLGLRFEVISRLSERSGGTDLQLHVETHWRRGLGPVARIVELAILNPREAQKELINLKTVVEQQSSA